MVNIKIRIERYRDFNWYTIYHNANSIDNLRLVLLKISSEFVIYSYNAKQARMAIKFNKSLLNEELNIKLYMKEGN